MEKLKVALIGFRATGKSAVGEILARKLGWEFLDMDEALVADFGQDIQAWVSAHGWEAFRRAESDLLRELGGRERLVVATGGGVVCDAANRERLQAGFFVVWLRALPATILGRLQQDPKTSSLRPALTGMSPDDEVRSVLAERSPWYEETAQLALATDNTAPEQLAEEILRAMLRTKEESDAARSISRSTPGEGGDRGAGA